MSTSTIEVFRHKYGEIPKFNGSNYQSWRAHLLQVLAAIDGDEIATGERQAPTAVNALRDYNKLKKQAAAIIFCSVSEAIHPHILAQRTEPAENAS